MKVNCHNSRTIDDINMNFRPVTKLDKRNKITSKKFDDDVMSADCGTIVIFPIYGQFGAIRKWDSGSIVCKTYIFINSNLLSYKIWKQNYKIFNTALTLLLWVNYYFLAKNAAFCAKKKLASAKLRRPWHYRVYFLKLHICILTYQISSF